MQDSLISTTAIIVLLQLAEYVLTPGMHRSQEGNDNGGSKDRQAGFNLNNEEVLTLKLLEQDMTILFLYYIQQYRYLSFHSSYSGYIHMSHG